MSRTEAADPNWRPRLRALGLDSLGPLLEESPAAGRHPGEWTALTKAGLGGRERWRWRPSHADVTADVYVKRYAATGLGGQWDRIYRQSARHSRAYWEYERSRELAGACIAAPRAVAYAEEMNGWLERRSTVLLEAVRGEPLDQYWVRACEAALPLTRGLARFDLMRRIGRFVAAFHGTGLCHRDLYLCHLFIASDGATGDPPQFAIIDLARTHRPRLLRYRWLFKDLAQFEYSARWTGFSRSDRLRALCAYLSLDPGHARVRWYVRRIMKKADVIERRERRKGRLPPIRPD